MPRPKKPRRLRFKPNVTYFKPVGVPLRTIGEVTLSPDEVEALKLHDVDKLDHIKSSKKMKISQPTFGRILNQAYKKIARALINGQAIRIEEKINK